MRGRGISIADIDRREFSLVGVLSEEGEGDLCSSSMVVHGSRPPGSFWSILNTDACRAKLTEIPFSAMGRVEVNAWISSRQSHCFQRPRQGLCLFHNKEDGHTLQRPDLHTCRAQDSDMYGFCQQNVGG